MLSCSYALAEYTANPAFPAYSDGGSSDSNEQRIEMRCIIDGNKGTFYIANTGPISFVPGTLYFTEESLTGNIVKQVEINDYPGSLKVELNFDHKDSKKYYARYVYASTGFAVWTGAIEVTAEITNVYLKYHRFTHMWPHILNQWYFYEPLYIDIDNKGNIFIADNGIKKFSGNGSFLSQWNHYGGAIAISKDNEVFVANNKTIQKFSHDSSFLSEFHIQLRLGDDSNITISEITVDKDGSVYVVLGSHDRVQQYALEDGQYKLKIEWGERGSNELQFNKPDGIAVFENINGTKYIVVTDSGNHRVQVFERNNDEEIIFIKSWGKNGSNPGEFKYPGAIAVDSYGQIYIGDTTKRIQVFDIDGNLIKEWWKANSLLVPFQRITDICANNKYVYFSDKGNAIYQYSLSGQFISCWDNKTDDYNLQKTNDLVVNSEKDMFIVDNEKHEIVRLDQTGKQINKWGQYGKNDEEFKYPRNIAIDKNENIYVTSSHKVQKFRPDGTFIWSRGSNGNDNEQFDFPCGIATDNEYIYIADRHNHRIQKMDFSGNFILSWGLQGYENGQFREPLAVAVDKNSGNIYVADSGNFRVQIFTSTGEYINQFGQEGEGEGEFSKPCDIVIAENSAVYVVDSVLNHIQKFEPDGTFITKIGMQGYFKSYFQQPCGLALHEDGTVYVAETINNRIQAFTPVTEALPDKAIILMGRKSSKDSLKDESKKCANYAYSALIQRGFTRETISFLSDNEPFDLDNNGSIDENYKVATIDNFKSAIKWGSDADNLIIYMVDHGGRNTFQVNQNEILSIEEFKSSLNAINNKVILIIDACYSGSFIRSLNENTDRQRIIITSTMPDQLAFFKQNSSLSFSFFFWTNIIFGKNLYDSFEQAKNAMAVAISKQNAMIDDNNDGQHNDSDGMIARSTFIGEGPVIGQTFPVFAAEARLITENHSHSVVVSVECPENTDTVQRIQAFILPSEYQQECIDNPVIDLPSIHLYPSLQNNNIYEGIFNNLDAGSNYSIFISAVDETGNTLISDVTQLNIENPFEKRAIIVQGYSDHNNSVECIKAAYSALKIQNFSDDTIYLMTHLDLPDQFISDSIPSSEKLRSQIESYASIPTEDVIIYLVGDGDATGFTISETEKLLFSDLNSWLSQLQETIPNTTTIVYDAPQSAHIIQALNPVDEKRRNIIASSGHNESAVFFCSGNLSFSYHFWCNVLIGMTISDAFEEASKVLLIISRQHHPEYKLYGTKDNYYIGFGITLASTSPFIENIFQPYTITQGMSGHLWVNNIVSLSAIEQVFAVIKPPDAMSNVSEIELEFSGTKTYEAVYNQFDQKGQYEVIVFAKNFYGGISPLSRSWINQPQSFIYGDWNQDGVFDLQDIIFCLNILVEKTSVAMQKITMKDLVQTFRLLSEGAFPKSPFGTTQK